MFPYIVKYTESEYDVQNNDLLDKIIQKHQNTFESLEIVWTILKQIKTSIFYFVFCINCIIHISYFFDFL